MPRVVFFDVSADEPIEPGIDGGLAKRENPLQFIIPVIDVSSVDEFAAKVTENGGKIVQAKMAIPGTGYLISCQDTEGNTFNIMKRDGSAK